MMKLPRRVRILPLLVAVSMLSFTVRLGEFFTGLSHSGSAFAQDKVQEVSDAKMPPMPGQAAAKDSKDSKNSATPAPADAAAPTSDGKAPMIDLPKLPPVDDNASAAKDADKKDGDKSAMPADAGKDKAADSKDSAAKPVSDMPKDDGKGPTVKAPDGWRDAGDEQFECPQVKEDLYKDLAARRTDIEKREKELGVRQALLEAGEREVDQKLKELGSIKAEIQGLLQQQSDAEKARTESLVKMYEGMKPQQAAVIFNTLDMTVLMQIVSNMSERKSGPILAEMDPERARNITVLLAQQRQLPKLSDSSLLPPSIPSGNPPPVPGKTQ
jgi:flagellar motility protein MotE (MotC chaperone)